jgi:hypothetical protein
MAAKNSTVTDHSVPTSKRVKLAAVAAWEITTLCDELLEHAAKIDSAQAPKPHHSARIIGALIVRAQALAEAAALCLCEDEASKPLAELERTVRHG